MNVNPYEAAESEVHDVLACDDMDRGNLVELAEDIVTALRELGWTPPK